MGLWTTYYLPNVYHGLALRNYNDRDMKLVIQFVPVTRWEFMEIYLHVPYKLSRTGAQLVRQAGITLLHPCHALYLYSMFWFWKSQFRASFHKLRYSQIKLFAPAEDCLAYTPNAGGGEVAAIERRTVNRDFSYKRNKCEINPHIFSSVAFSAFFHFFLIYAAASRHLLRTLQSISHAI